MIATTAALGVSFSVVLIVVRWMIWRGFRPPRLPHDRQPADHTLKARDIVVTSRHGKRLFGWILDAEAGAPVILIVHGWGANAALMLPLAAPLRRHGFSVVLFDARSHGRSDQDTFSSMPRFAEDIDDILDWVRESGPLFPSPSATVILGHSVGGAAALLAASRRQDVDAVISLSSFDHPERVMRATLSRIRIPYHPLGWAICRYVERIIGHRFDDIAPVTTIARIRCPVLIGHGAEDRLVPTEAARAIHARGAADRCELAIIEGTGHDSPVDYDLVGALLIRFLERTLPQSPPTP